MRSNKGDSDQSQTPRSLLVRLYGGGGHPSDWERFCGIYAPFAFRLARNQGLCVTDANEAAAIVIRTLFVRFKNGFQRDGQPGAFRRYVATLTRTAVRDWRRTQRRQKELPASRAGLGIGEEQADSPADQLERAEMLERLRYCVSELRTHGVVRRRTWEVFNAFALQGESAKSVAARFDVTPDHVYVIKNEMLCRIRTLMASLDADFRELK